MILKQKIHTGIKLVGYHVEFDSCSMKHCMPKCHDHISDT